MQQPILELRKKRDFGEVISETFQFIRQNFKPLVRAALFIAGPFLLGAAIYFTVSYVNMLTGISSQTFGRSGSYTMNMLVSLIFILAGQAMLFTVVHDYIKLLLSGKKKEEITVAAVWQLARADVWKAIGINLMLGLIFVVSVFLIALIVSALGVFGVLFALGGIVAIIFLAGRLSLAHAAGLVENYSVGDSLARSWEMTAGKFWSSLGTLFVLTLVVGVCSYLLYIPIMLLAFVILQHGGNMEISLVWKSMVVILQAAGYLVVFMGYMVPAIGLILQYLGCVESKEGHGLMERIEELKLETDESHWGEETY
jgi:hypothetical protein